MSDYKPLLGRKRGTEKPDAQAALDALQAAVREAEDVPCRTHPEPLWISEDYLERRYAAAMCRTCPLLDLCGDYGRRESFGVWAGVDRTKTARTAEEVA